MVIEPKVRGFICTTAHPVGCAAYVKEQMEYVQSKGPLTNSPKKVLILGASQGFGLASRITLAFAGGADTLGVFFEKPAAGDKPASAGWYLTAAFEKEAQDKGLYARSFNGDAFSDEIKTKVLEAIKNDLGQVDMIIYSLAAPRRTDPRKGQTYQSTLKPKAEPYSNKTVNTQTGEVTRVTIETATAEEVSNTVGVMGGEDWKYWIEDLLGAGLLAPGCRTVAYSYIGPDLTYPVYRNGTIGAAKDHLEATAKELDTLLADKIGGRAWVSVNKALVTQASSAIPVIPMYISILYKVMKKHGVHEGCIEQMQRLFAEKLCSPSGEIPVDEAGRIRVDDWELRADIQQEVKDIWVDCETSNFKEVADFEGYRQEFMRLFGFGLEGVDYAADVEHDVQIPGLFVETQA
jgi:enoyl-[acyl-carrier protein] reductase/trans-2-enoyl-CoA reductase (NAD+)